LFRVLRAGGDPAKCTFAGVGKSREEIEFACEQGVYSFNVESESELEQIDQIAGEKNLRAPIALRANPDVDPHTHEYISTGSRENKFGIALGQLLAVYEGAAKMRNIEIVVVQMHIGSQLTPVRNSQQAAAKYWALFDAGMRHLIRPALYHTSHGIGPFKEPSKSPNTEKFSSGGPVCESDGFFALDREMREVHEGDLLAI